MGKAVRFDELGGPEVLKLVEVEVGEPGPGELRIRVQAIGLNRAEAMFRSGTYINQPRLPGSGLGYEGTGVVEAVGPEVTGFEPGQPVSVVPAFSMTDYPFYAERAIVPARAVLHRPDDIDPVTGAAIWMPFLTVYGALVEIGQLRAGDAVLITAASSSVGLAAIQVANRLGATPIAATRTNRKKQQLLDAGAAHVIVTDEEDVVAKVHEYTDGRGVEIVFDPIGGPGLSVLAEATATGGTLFLYGALSGEPTPLPGSAGFRPVFTRPYTLREFTVDPERLRRAVAFVTSGLRTGAFKPVVDRTFDLTEIVEAHRYLEANKQVGKIVVTVGDGS